MKASAKSDSTSYQGDATSAATAAVYKSGSGSYLMPATDTILTAGQKLIDNADIVVYNMVAQKTAANTVGDKTNYPYRVQFRTSSNAVNNAFATLKNTATTAEAALTAWNTYITANTGEVKGGTGFIVDVKTACDFTIHNFLAANKDAQFYDITDGTSTKFVSTDANVINDWTCALKEGHVYYVYSNGSGTSSCMGIDYKTTEATKVI